MKRKTKTADEFDVVTRWRRWTSWKRGEVAKIKRGMNRRERHEALQEIERELKENTESG